VVRGIGSQKEKAEWGGNEKSGRPGDRDAEGSGEGTAVDGAGRGRGAGTTGRRNSRGRVSGW